VCQCSAATDFRSGRPTPESALFVRECLSECLCFALALGGQQSALVASTPVELMSKRRRHVERSCIAAHRNRPRGGPSASYLGDDRAPPASSMGKWICTSLSLTETVRFSRK
jgi:hypothetical protein